MLRIQQFTTKPSQTQQNSGPAAAAPATRTRENIRQYCATRGAAKQNQSMATVVQ